MKNKHTWKIPSKHSLPSRNQEQKPVKFFMIQYWLLALLFYFLDSNVCISHELEELRKEAARVAPLFWSPNTGQVTLCCRREHPQTRGFAGTKGRGSPLLHRPRPLLLCLLGAWHWDPGSQDDLVTHGQPL